MGNYETVCIVACAYSAHDAELEYDKLYHYEIPKPEGDKWKLIHVLPVHNNPKFNQYFWERMTETKPAKGEVNMQKENQLQLKESVLFKITKS